MVVFEEEDSSSSSEEEDALVAWRPLCLAAGCCVVLTLVLFFTVLGGLWPRPPAPGCDYVAVGDGAWSVECTVLAGTNGEFVQTRLRRDVRGVCADANETRACLCDACEQVNLTYHTGRSFCELSPDPPYTPVAPPTVEVYLETRCAMSEADTALGPLCGGAYYTNISDDGSAECWLPIYFADPPTPPPPPPPELPPVVNCSYEPLTLSPIAPCYVDVNASGVIVRDVPMVASAPNVTLEECPPYNATIPCECGDCQAIGSFGATDGNCTYDARSGACLNQTYVWHVALSCVVADAPDLVCSDNTTVVERMCNDPEALFNTDCPPRAAAEGYCTVDGNCTAGTPCQVPTCTNNTCLYPAKNCTSYAACFEGLCNATDGECYNAVVPSRCDDNDECTTDACNSTTGACTHTVGFTLVTQCGGGSICNASVGWVSVPPVDCADDDPCTTDTCDTETDSCVHTPIGGCVGSCVVPGDCPAADNCKYNSCIGGLCYVNATDCPTVDPCLPAFCNVTSDACETAPLHCGDNNKCTTDSCSGGVCSHTPVSCSPANLCETATCNVTSGACVATSTVCTTADPCETVACDLDTGLCAQTDYNLTCAGKCNTAGDCLPDPLDTCSSVTCVGGYCQITTKRASCIPDACHVFLDDCNVTAPALDCLYGPLPELDDGDNCTVDVCAAGVVTHVPLCPADDNLCTLEECEPADGGSCTSSEAVACPPSDDTCFGSVCYPPTGTCVLNASLGIDCDDGDACTIDSCSNSTCIHNTTDTCDDGIYCTESYCNATSAECVVTPNATKCPEISMCLEAVCTTGRGGGCEYYPTSAALACAATLGECDPLTGACTDPVDCNDWNPCTTDVRLADDTCQHNPRCVSSFCHQRTCPGTDYEPCDDVLLFAGCCEVDADCGAAGRYCNLTTRLCVTPPAVINTCGVDDTCNRTGWVPALADCEVPVCVVTFANATLLRQDCVRRADPGLCPHLDGYDSQFGFVEAMCLPQICQTPSGCLFQVHSWLHLSSTGCCITHADCPDGYRCAPDITFLTGQCVPCALWEFWCFL